MFSEYRRCPAASGHGLCDIDSVIGVSVYFRLARIFHFLRSD